MSPNGDAQEDRRALPREPVLHAAKVVFDQTILDCVVLDLSERGAHVQFGTFMRVPERFELRLNQGAAFSAIKRWAAGTRIGLRFEGPAVLRDQPARAALQAYDLVRQTTLEPPLRLLRSWSYFHDLELQAAAVGAETALRQLERMLRDRVAPARGEADGS